MRRRLRRGPRACLALLLAAAIGGYAYVSDYYHADEQAVAAMAELSDTVEIARSGDVTWFVPEAPVAGLIFYPGGKVEADAYAPLLRTCARRGILCGLTRMPARLVVLDGNAADGLRQEYPDITDWYMAGHSLGGVMAASYAADHAGDFSGLILLAAYSTRDLSDTPLRVLSVSGSEDGVLDRAAYEENRARLPAAATELLLEGGCHAQFGSYGPQKGDGTPTISGEEQIRQTAEAVAAFVRE